MSRQVNVFSYQTESGKLWGYRFEGASVDGKRKWFSKRGFKTKGEATTNGRDAQLQYESKGEIASPSEMSYSDFIDLWLKSLVGTLKVSTIDNYEKKVKLYIKPYLGHRKLNTISKDDIRKLMCLLSEKGCVSSSNGLSKNTLYVIKGIIQKSFTFAVEEKLIEETPIVGRFPFPRQNIYTKKSNVKENPHVYIPPDKIQMIFERFPEGSTDHIPMMLGYKCGLRIGEAFAVTWDDINFSEKTLSVSKQVQWRQDKTVSEDERRNPNKRTSKYSQPKSKGAWCISKPKYNSVRIMRIDDELYSLLCREKEQQEKDKEYYSDLYFYYYLEPDGRITTMQTEESTPINFINVRRDGEFISPRTMQHTSSVIHKSLKYPEFDFHSLRHTHATLLMEGGATPMYVQHRLGHKNIDVTLRVYFHYTDKMDMEGAEVLTRIFNKF